MWCGRPEGAVPLMAEGVCRRGFSHHGTSGSREHTSKQEEQGTSFTGSLPLATRLTELPYPSKYYYQLESKCLKQESLGDLSDPTIMRDHLPSVLFPAKPQTLQQCTWLVPVCGFHSCRVSQPQMGMTFWTFASFSTRATIFPSPYLLSHTV